MSELDESLLSDKVCKVLGTQRVYKEGLLFKRQRGLQHGNQKKLKFQERFCRLTQISLDYYDPNPKKRDCPKGQFAVNQIRIIESMPPVTFGKDYLHLHPFQVGDNSEIMYFSTKSLVEREEWLVAFRKASRDNKTRMLSHYHKGIFGLTLKGRWGCCGSPQRATPGCSPVPFRDPPPLTPQRLRATSIIQDDFSKPRSETAGDIMGGGEEGGDQTDWGEPIESTSPQDSLRIRSFTLIAPVRSKPDPKKLRENSSSSNKRTTVDFEYLDSGRRGSERDEMAILKETEELAVGSMPTRWGSDFAAELSGREEGKRPSSPSPSDDSGKGTSTGSSRPNSQVISVDTEDGMRPSRSWSLGKNNSLSPLTDQITPAHRQELAEGNRMIVNGTNETDGQAHSSVERTPGVGEEMKHRGGEGRREEEEAGDIMGRELEDTLKAIDQKRVRRNMSSPPGINYEEDIHTETSSVRLRSKIHISHSMDTINNCKRGSLQPPPSPLVMHKFDFPPTPTQSPHLNRLSKSSTSSGSPQPPRARQSNMIQSVLVSERPDASLRRRRVAEEYTPLHKACKDGNVAALWDMLNGPDLLDLEEPTLGATPYTPLFLAFMNDHFQTVVCLLDHGADPAATEPVNRAPVLHLACERGCSDMVDLLLEYNVDVNQTDCRGNTALWQACRNGHLDIVVKLLESGAILDVEGDNHRTPLHMAASGGHVSIVQLLIKEGANPCPRDNHDVTPYDIAYTGGHKQVMQVLQELIPEAVRPYSLLHSYTSERRQMVTSLVFTDTDTLVSGSRDCHATFWELNEEPSVKQRVHQQNSILDVGKWEGHLVVSSTFVTLNSLDDPNQRRIVADDTQEDESLTNPPLHFASFGPEGVLVTASVEGHVVKIWPPITSQTGIDMQPQTRLAVGVSKETPQPGIIHSLSVSQSVEHPWLAVGLQPGSLFEPQGNKTVYLYNWQEEKVHQIFDAGTGGLAVSVHTVFSPCGRQLAIGCHENLCIWEPATGDLLYKFTTTKKSVVKSLSYSPNGAHLAVGLASGEVQVFDIDSNCCIFTLEQHKEYPSAATAVAYSENGQLLAVGHRNGQIQIWKAYTGLTSL